MSEVPSKLTHAISQFELRAKQTPIAVSHEASAALLTLLETLLAVARTSVGTIAALLVAMVPMVPGYKEALCAACRYLVRLQLGFLRIAHCPFITDLGKVLNEHADTSCTVGAAAFAPVFAQVKASYVEAVYEVLAADAVDAEDAQANAVDAEDAQVVVANDDALPVAQPVEAVP